MELSFKGKVGLGPGGNLKNSMLFESTQEALDALQSRLEHSSSLLKNYIESL